MHMSVGIFLVEGRCEGVRTLLARERERRCGPLVDSEQGSGDVPVGCHIRVLIL
jgi:hypothetical protein